MEHFFGPDWGPNCLTLMVFLKEFFEKVDFEKISRRQKSMRQTVKEYRYHILSNKCTANTFSQNSIQFSYPFMNKMSSSFLFDTLNFQVTLYFFL